MMTLQWIDLRCPVCESTFESMAALSTGISSASYRLRIGDTKQAASWFERVSEEVVDPELQRSLMEAAQLQIAQTGRFAK